MKRIAGRPYPRRGHILPLWGGGNLKFFYGSNANKNERSGSGKME